MNLHFPAKKTSNFHQQNSSEDHSASPEPDQMEESDEVKDQGSDESEDEASAGEDDRTLCPVCFRKYRRVRSHLVKVCSHFLTSQVQGLMMNEESYRKPQFIGYGLDIKVVADK